MDEWKDVKIVNVQNVKVAMFKTKKMIVVISNTNVSIAKKSWWVEGPDS